MLMLSSVCFISSTNAPLSRISSTTVRSQTNSEY
jgi:hypothetical protein